MNHFPLEHGNEHGADLGTGGMLRVAARLPAAARLPTPARMRTTARLLAPAVCFSVVLSIWPTSAEAAPSILRPATQQAEEIKSLAVFLFVLSAIILFVVEAVLIFSIVRFRGRPENQVRQTHGNNTIEAAWTLIPTILIIIIFAMTARTMDSLELPGGDVELQVVGHQWWWEIKYPEQGFVTANEIHVPEGREVGIDLNSADVIHSFWVPQIGGKTDLVPGHTNRVGFLAATPGTYLGQCAEFCGLQHAHMRFYLVVESAAEFSAWVKHQQQPASEPTTDAARRGRDVFFSSPCIGCHAIRGTTAAGVLGPDLTHMAGRLSLGAGTLENTPEDLRRWLEDPQAVKPGNLMPAPALDSGQLDDLVVYLEGLE